MDDAKVLRMSAQDAGEDQHSCKKQAAHSDLPKINSARWPKTSARKYDTNFGIAAQRHNTSGATTIARTIEFEI
jgi:hypothetical protein